MRSICGCSLLCCLLLGASNNVTSDSNYARTTGESLGTSTPGESLLHADTLLSAEATKDAMGGAIIPQTDAHTELRELPLVSSRVVVQQNMEFGCYSIAAIFFAVLCMMCGNCGAQLY